MTKRNSNQQKQDAPILLYTDEAEVRNAQYKLEGSIIPALDKVKQAFDKLEIGPLTDAWLKDLLSSGIQTIQRELTLQIEKEIPSHFLQDEARRAAQKKLSLVSKALEDLNSLLDQYAMYDLLEYPSVDKAGNIELTEDAIQVLRGANSIYVTSPKAKELYKVHQAAATALNRFYQMVKAEITSNSSDLARFFTIEEGTVKPEVIDYEYSEYVTGKARNFI